LTLADRQTAFKPFGLADAPSLRSGSGPPSACPSGAMHSTKQTSGRAWTTGNPDDAQIPTSPATATSPRGRTGARVELARYAVSAGERVLHGQRIDGVVRVTDVPADGPGRSYLVERGLEHEEHANAALQALIADYLRQARQLDAIPMAHSLLARDLQALAS